MGAQLPNFPAARTGRVGGILQATALIAPVQPDFVGGTLGVAFRQVIIHILEPTGLGVQIHLRPLAAHGLPRIAIEEGAVDPRHVARPFQRDALGAQPLTAALQTDIAFQQRLGRGRFDPACLGLNGRLIGRWRARVDGDDLPRQLVGLALAPGVEGRGWLPRLNTARGQQRQCRASR
jgi:hypothetical protein